MALEQKLSLKLSQRLVMTPSLQQAIKLLQMTRHELEATVNQELVENPTLEQLEDGEEATGEGESADSSEANSEGAAEESPEPSDQAGAEASAEGGGDQDTAAPEPAVEEPAAEPEPDDLSSLDDIDIDAYFNDYLDGAGSTAASTFELREAPPLENTLSFEEDLSEHLLFQVHMQDLMPLERELAELVIGNLNEDGFLRATVEELQLAGATREERERYLRLVQEWEECQQRRAAVDAETTDRPAVMAEGDMAVADDEIAYPSPESIHMPTSSHDAVGQAARQATVAAPVTGALSGDAAALSAATTEQETPTGPPETPGYPRTAVEEAIARVQALEPAGVGAPDLRGSLLLQLEAAGEDETLAYELVLEDWELLLKRQFQQIAKRRGIPLKELQEPFERIKLLETRPGREYGGGATQYVEPDVVVAKVGGEYVVQVNDDGMPRLRVSKGYKRMLRQMRAEGRESDAQQYLREKMRSAMWLIKSLDQRQRTIYKVARSIVKQQRGFLEGGIEHLRPMVLRDVAEDIGMHESTVSRVVSNKYIHTPRGLYPMKFFFHSGIDSDQGEDISSLTVKRKIQNFIAGENAKKPLSDSELMRRLNAEGIKIARRTVAKYRDELNIPSSTDRKQVF